MIEDALILSLNTLVFIIAIRITIIIIAIVIVLLIITKVPIRNMVEGALGAAAATPPLSTNAPLADALITITFIITVIITVIIIFIIIIIIIIVIAELRLQWRALF